MSDLMDDSPVQTLPPNQDDNKPPQNETVPLPSSSSSSQLTASAAAASPTPSVQEPGQIAVERDYHRNDMRDDKGVVDEHRRKRGSRDYYEDRNTSSSRPRYRDRSYKQYASRRLSPRAHHHKRSRSPSYKRSRREDGGHDRGKGDKRFGYEDGHQLGTGRRFAYADERNYGWHLQDWEAARGGGRSKSKSGSDTNLKSSTEGMMSYKQFTLRLEDDIEPSEAGRRYQEYTSKYISTQKKTFFKLHKEEEWLKEKYHPTNLLDFIERRNKHARKAAHDFLLEVRCGSLNLGPKRGTAPKAHPVSSNPRRVIIDIGRAQALIQKLDSEKGILDNILSKGSTHHVITVRGLNYVKGLEGQQLLDTLTAYLWSIHGVDYYGMVETSEPKGFRHIISETLISETTTPYICEWEMNLDSHWNKRLDGQDPLELLTAKEKIDAAAVQALDLYVCKIGDEMFGCGARGCTKLFRDSKYVIDHLQLKHPDLVMELTAELCEDLYFENYMKDPNAPRSIPVIRKTIVPSRTGPFVCAPSEVARRMLREQDAQAVKHDPPQLRR